jgi:hypothetical protein
VLDYLFAKSKQNGFKNFTNIISINRSVPTIPACTGKAHYSVKRRFSSLRHTLPLTPTAYLFFAVADLRRFKAI